MNWGKQLTIVWDMCKLEEQKFDIVYDNKLAGWQLSCDAGVALSAGVAVQPAAGVARLTPDGAAAERAPPVPSRRRPEAPGAVDLPGCSRTPPLRGRLERCHANVWRERCYHYPSLLC